MSLEERLLEIEEKIKEKYVEIGKLKHEEIRVRNALYTRIWNELHGWKEAKS